MFHKVTVFTNAAFKDHEVTYRYMASNNIKSIGKSIGVKVSPILVAKVLVSLLAILFASIVNKPGHGLRVQTRKDCDPSDLYRHYSPVISPAVATCACLPSCPGHARVHDGWRQRFRVMQAKRERKPNEIRLSINNRLIQFDQRLRTKFESSILTRQ